MLFEDLIIEWNKTMSLHEGIWFDRSRRSEKYKKAHNDRAIYRGGSTRSTTRHPCSRTLKSSTTGSKIESLLSCISRWIGVRDDDRWMQVEISAFSSLSFSSFLIFLYGKIFMGWRWSRWNDVGLSCLKDVWAGFYFCFVYSSITKKGNVTK